LVISLRKVYLLSLSRLHANVWWVGEVTSRKGVFNSNRFYCFTYDQGLVTSSVERESQNTSSILPLCTTVWVSIPPLFAVPNSSSLWYVFYLREYTYIHNSIICTPYFSSQLYHNNVLIEPNTIVKFSQEKLPSDLTNIHTLFVIEASVIAVIFAGYEPKCFLYTLSLDPSIPNRNW
jgi:hypothetical protein